MVYFGVVISNIFVGCCVFLVRHVISVLLNCVIWLFFHTSFEDFFNLAHRILMVSCLHSDVLVSMTVCLHSGMTVCCVSNGCQIAYGFVDFIRLQVFDGNLIDHRSFWVFFDSFNLCFGFIVSLRVIFYGYFCLTTDQISHLRMA